MNKRGRPPMDNTVREQMKNDLRATVDELRDRIEQLEAERVQNFIPYPCPKCAVKKEYNVIRWNHVGVLSLSNEWLYKVEGICPSCDTLYLLDVPHLHQRRSTYERPGSAVSLPGEPKTVEVAV